jgi:hypothetical protein
MHMMVGGDAKESILCKCLTLEDDDDEDFSALLELPAPFSISQRFPSVGLPRAARACSSSRRSEKSGKVNDDLFLRIFAESFLSLSKRDTFGFTSLSVKCFLFYSAALNASSMFLKKKSIQVSEKLVMLLILSFKTPHPS